MKRPTLVELALARRAAEQMETFFETELVPRCFKCGQTLGPRNESGACREHFKSLPKKKKRVRIRRKVR